MNNAAQEALARAMYTLELGRGDLDDLADLGDPSPEIQEKLDCIQLHLDDTVHWLQEVEQAESLDLVELMEAFVPTNDSNRDERAVLLRRKRHEQLEQALSNRLPSGTLVEVTEWAGCDEDWELPIYVTADGLGVEYYDAVADLATDTFETQVDYILEQLRNG